MQTATMLMDEKELLKTLEKLIKKVESYEGKLVKALEKIDDLSSEKINPELTRREEELLKIIQEKGKEMTIAEFAEIRNISYSAAYKLLNSLEEKGYIKSVIETKGNKLTFKLIEAS